MIKAIAFSFSGNRPACIERIAEALNALREHDECQLIVTDFNAGSADKQFADLDKFMSALEREDELFLFSELVHLPCLAETVPASTAVRIDISLRKVTTSRREIDVLVADYKANRQQNRVMIELLRLKWGDKRFYQEFATTADAYNAWLHGETPPTTPTTERKRVVLKGPRSGR